jgi:predicted Zn-dependent peptidase
VLENGVRVVTESVKGVRSVSIGVIVDCGPKDETDAEAGLAHLCEHLLFQGTGARDAREIARQVDLFGHAGGVTTRDYTCCYASTLDDYQYYALDLLGDVLLNSTFPDQYLQRERQAILSEMERGRDVPEQYVHDLARSKAWRGGTLGRPIAGHARTVARFTREDAIYFLQRHYTPDRIVIAASGCLDHEDFVAQTRDAFWRLLGYREPAPRRSPVFCPGLTAESINSAQAYFSLAIPAPDFADPDRYVVHIVNRILGGGISSRLSRKLREQAGLVYDVHSEYHAYRDGGMISVEGSTQPEHLAEVAALAVSSVADLLTEREPVEAEELWRAKTHLRIEHMMSSEDTYTRMCRLATQELYLGRHLESGMVLAEIDGVDLAGISRFCRRYWSDFSGAHLAAAGPLPGWHELRARLSEPMSRFSQRRWNYRTTPKRRR